MERESQSSVTSLIEALGEKLPYVNFYRLCQLIENSCAETSGLGRSSSLKDDPIRFRPHRGMGFPVTEIKGLDSFNRYRPSTVPSIRTTFLGLYGITSPLPTTYLNDIAQYRDGTDSLTDFLDIFNHRLTTQFYRIWRKYSYPATFQAGGTDETSKYLYGLIGLGIPGCANHVESPLSRFLALLGILRLPTRTAEGIHALVKLLAPSTNVDIIPHDPRQIILDKPTQMSCKNPTTLENKPVLGAYAFDVNSQVLIQLQTDDKKESKGWLPDGSIYQDFMALLRVYLGSRVNARLCLRLPRHLLADATLSSKQKQGVQLGRTAVMRPLSSKAKNNATPSYINIGLGFYQYLAPRTQHYKSEEYGNYKF
ncbi:type VI secretion system baseplate subunit TssG [Proteus mirabilis]|uniref:type VI secretion system baseplate subunit TssG n=1 Tax=Proteus TaxID=583 RepID=UPI00089197A2|nr:MULTISPECIES: type VI secretion system baseplate subunit TssG [Proteus]EHZ8015334.1 type VI secretion system baseplate subunit TssG [Proteus mirabilis]EKV1611585.1 type VI secretion system baseplate subunit TssG [Proteus mirabilis]EKV2710471.1 type VI secretion system baseplate subunit TssG [Proteus mirabilis]EKV6230901.1 type VI secretion system baseplate subunit TssG [Proteus mirabilis]EKV7661319.1 type VI secretion system baseplate subunit TssG [Proteus mirabilis]